MINFTPINRDYPNTIDVSSAWGNIPTILKDIIERFDIKTNKAIEFGVEFGYSTSALASYFDKVVGVDIFTGDVNAGFKGDIYEETTSNLKDFNNITLFKSSYQDYIKTDTDKYDMAHVDIVHSYNETFECGDWCINNSDIVIFHDTLSFPEVYRACQDLASKHNLYFYNYAESHGLGILSKKLIL
jgi:predicted O-methyltransferase YrrM